MGLTVKMSLFLRASHKPASDAVDRLGGTSLREEKDFFSSDLDCSDRQE